MVDRLKPGLAASGVGCLLCGTWGDEMVRLVEREACVCRPCVTKIGQWILAAGGSSVSLLWSIAPLAPMRQRDLVPADEIDVEATFAAFKLGVDKQIKADDAQSHFDLAVAYCEMGLLVDALREAAVALGEGARLPIASRALNWIFAPDRARPDALQTMARAVGRH